MDVEIVGPIRRDRDHRDGASDATAEALGSTMKKRRKGAATFAVCIKNKGYEASLEIGKLYRVLPDEDARAHGYLRIVDESGEDYGHRAGRFGDA